MVLPFDPVRSVRCARLKVMARTCGSGSSSDVIARFLRLFPRQSKRVPNRLEVLYEFNSISGGPVKYLKQSAREIGRTRET